MQAVGDALRINAVLDSSGPQPPLPPVVPTPFRLWWILLVVVAVLLSMWLLVR